MKNIYQTRRRAKERYLGNTLPKYFFIFFAAVGSASIWLLKRYVPESGGEIAAVVAVALIVIYCALSYSKRLLTIREDIIGDNAYYLGFLFTLTSLSYALFNFTKAGADANSIIESFGIALWSTIAGIAARVFFAQLRQDPDDIEKDARARIAETANALNTQLGAATVSFNEYRRGLEQSLAEAFTDNKSKINDSLLSSLEKFTATTESMASHIDHVFKEFSSHTEKLNKASEKTVVALENLNQRISGIESPDHLVNKKFEVIFANLDTAGEKLALVTNSQTNSTAEIVAGARALLENINSLNSQMEFFRLQSQAAKESTQSLENLTEKIDALPSSFEKLTEGLSVLIEQQNKAIQKISSHADALEEQLERSRSYTEQTHTALSSMSRTLADKLA